MKSIQETSRMIVGWQKGMRVLEIGCGAFPYDENHILLDIRPVEGVRIDLVQDASDLSNVYSDSLEGIITRDCLEHISWRMAKVALREWHRVLDEGGTLDVEVPCALHLAKILEDPQCYGRSPSESDFEFFSRVAFGHQDYPENSHLCYFKHEWLEDMLMEVGFSRVETIKSDMIIVRLKATK